MANHASAKKRIRQTARRTVANGAKRQRVRTFIKRVEAAIASGDKGVAQDALKAAQPEMMSGVSSGIFHINTMSRKLSRLSARVKALG